MLTPRWAYNWRSPSFQKQNREYLSSRNWLCHWRFPCLLKKYLSKAINLWFLLLSRYTAVCKHHYYFFFWYFQSRVRDLIGFFADLSVPQSIGPSVPPSQLTKCGASRLFEPGSAETEIIRQVKRGRQPWACETDKRPKHSTTHRYRTSGTRPHHPSLPLLIIFILHKAVHVYPAANVREKNVRGEQEDWQ